MATVTATKYNPDIKSQYEHLQQNGKCKIQALPKSGWFSLILNLLKLDLTLVCRDGIYALTWFWLYQKNKYKYLRSLYLISSLS